MKGGLLVIGAGGHGRVVADTALQMAQWDGFAFADDELEEGSRVLDWSVVGTTTSLPELRAMYRSAVVAIGSSRERLRLLRLCKSLGFNLPIVCHPTSSVSQFASLSEGCVVCAQAAVNAGAVLEMGCIVNTSASVDHDCVLGEGVHVCPGAHLSGNVRVGSGSWIGLGSCIRQGLVLGEEVMVGAGSVVVNDIESGLTVMGVPAKARRRK